MPCTAKRRSSPSRVSLISQTRCAAEQVAGPSAQLLDQGLAQGGGAAFQLGLPQQQRAGAACEHQAYPGFDCQDCARHCPPKLYPLKLYPFKSGHQGFAGQQLQPFAPPACVGIGV